MGPCCLLRFSSNSADKRIQLPLSPVGGGGGDGQSVSDGQVIMGGVLGSGGCRVFSAPTNTSHSDLDLRGQVPSLLLWCATSWAGRKDRKWSASASSSTTGRHTEGLSLLFKLLLVDDNQLQVARPSSLYDIFYR